MTSSNQRRDLAECDRLGVSRIATYRLLANQVP